MNMLNNPKPVGLMIIMIVSLFVARVAWADFFGAPLDSAGPHSPAASGQTDCLPPPAGMIGWWPFDRLESFDGDEEWFRDKAGINNFGKMVENPQIRSDEHVGNSIILNGAGDSVRVAHHPELAFGAGDLSIDAWVRISDADPGNGRRPIVDKIAAGSLDNPVGFSLFVEGGHLGFTLNGTSGPLASVLSQVALPSGWHFVAVTVVRDAGALGGLGTLYIDDGPPETFALAPSLATVDNEVDLYIGTDHRELSLQRKNFFWGEIDEVELFRRALTPDEIADIFGRGKAGKCKKPPYPSNDPEFAGVASLVNIDVVNHCGAPAQGFRFVLSEFGPGPNYYAPGDYAFDTVFEVPCPNPATQGLYDCNPFSTPIALPSYTANTITLGWQSPTPKFLELDSAHFGYTLHPGDQHRVTAQLLTVPPALCVAVDQSAAWSMSSTTVTLTLQNQSPNRLELVASGMVSQLPITLEEMLPSNEPLMLGLRVPLSATVLGPGDLVTVTLPINPMDKMAVVRADWYAYDGQRGDLQARAFLARPLERQFHAPKHQLYLPRADSEALPQGFNTTSGSRDSFPEMQGVEILSTKDGGSRN